jgi:twitching motility protein PilU
MQTFDQSVFALYKSGQISYEDALKNADSENEVRLMIKLDAETSTMSEQGQLDPLSLQADENYTKRF